MTNLCFNTLDESRHVRSAAMCHCTKSLRDSGEVWLGLSIYPQVRERG
jgi:hypothetical protein